MSPADLAAQFRRDVSDQEAPYLWGNEELYLWMDDAQKMFCRLTDGIADASASVCRINVVPGTDWYSVSPKITKLRFATRADTGRPVRLLSAEKAPEYGVRFDGRPGPLNALVQGLEKNKLRAWPMPDETFTVELGVFRLPLETITEDSQDFEIDEQHHLGLLHWIKHKAYGKEDAETFDRRKSDEHEQRFIAYCAKAKEEENRARHPAGTVAYGGI